MRFVRGRTLAFFALAVLAGAALLHVSQMVQNAQDEVARLESEIDNNEQALRVLKAEWVYLNSPERLESLAHIYLDMDLPNAKSAYAPAALLVDAPEIVPVPPMKRFGVEMEIGAEAQLVDVPVVLETKPAVVQSVVFAPMPVKKPAARPMVKPAASRAPVKRKPVMRKRDKKESSFNDLLGRLESKSSSDGGAP